MDSIGKSLVMLALWSSVMASSLAVVYVTHKSRLATHQLERLRHQASDLQVESGQLLLEKSTLAAFVRVEQKALNELGMKVPELDEIIVIKP